MQQQQVQQCPHLTPDNLANTVQGKFIYKDQCTKCFSDPFGIDGIKVCLKCFNGGCISKFNHSEEHFKNTNHSLALIFKSIKIKVVQEPVKEDVELTAEQKLTKMINDVQEKFDIQTETQLFCFACNKNIDGGQLTAGLIDSVMKAECALFSTVIESIDIQILPCEHTLTLQQVDSFKIKDNSLAHCGECQLSSNLWLCMTCGHLGCGRKIHGEAIGITGGNNHAIEHSDQFQHPLVVKIGTITPEGTASIYCYTCNDDVKDENLAIHLANFGIKVADQKKTEKTTQEIDLQANLNLQLSKSMEQGKLLEPVFGCGLTGIQNMGNTCYINSVLQVLFSLDHIKTKYFQQGLQHLKACKKFAPDCLICQFSKIGYGLQSGDYSIKKEAKILEAQNKAEEQKSEAVMVEKTEFYQEGIQIHNFKQLIGKGHKEFSTSSQQDAQEFMNHLFDQLKKAEKQINFGDITQLFNFKQVTLLNCLKCGGYKIRENQSSEIKLNCPYIKQEKDEDEYQVNFSELLSSYLQGEVVEVHCPKCGGGSNSYFRKNQYMASLPQYLIVSIQRFVFDNWVPTKVQAYVQVQESIDLQQFLFKEPQNPELKLNDGDDQQQQQPQVNQEALNALVQMGFSANRATRALLANNQNTEEAMNWIFATIDDASLDAPLQNKQKEGSNKVNEILIEQITQMGFSPQQAKFALSKTNNDVERAIDYLFNHPDEMMIDENEQQQKQIQQDQQLQQQQDVNQQSKSTKYELQGGIIHLGKSVHCGHYVCYTKNEKNEWIYFNDSKVALSQDPLLGKAYIYIYKQV